MNNTRASDTGAPLEWFKNQGYYQVGDRIFSSKTGALLHASSTKQDLSWHFAKEEFAKVNWRQKMGLDLRALYRMRAQQLREKYSYLMLCWSGGADSTTMLLAFLNNGIRLDEVIIWWPYSMMRGKYNVSFDRSAKNIISEWDLSIFPQMQALKSRFPNQKFTVLDESFDCMPEDRDDTMLLADHCPNFFTVQRYRGLDSFGLERHSLYRDAAMILGVGPCPLVRIDQYLCMYPADVGTVVRSSYVERYGRRTEWFFTTPEFPELAREQAHAMLEHFQEHPKDTQALQYWTMNQDKNLTYQSSGYPENLRMIYKKTVYPDYDSSTFQVRKPSDWIVNYDYGNHFQSISGIDQVTVAAQYHINSQISVIDPKYCRFHNGKLLGFRPLFTRPYVIGKLPLPE